MEHSTFEPFVVDGTFAKQPANILIDPGQPWCTISEDFVIRHSFEEGIRSSDYHIYERYVINNLSLPTVSGRYMGIWLMSTRTKMDHDVCIGANWINKSNIRVEGGSILDPESSLSATDPMAALWQAERTFELTSATYIPSF